MGTRGSTRRLLGAVASTFRPGPAKSLAVTMMTLRARREAIGMSQEELAEQLNITREHLNRLENDQRRATAEFLFRWASKLGGEVGVTFPVTSKGE